MAVTTLPFLQVLLGRQSAMFEDILDYNVPNIRANWHALLSGHSPFWTPFVYSGFNRLGSGQTGIFYPPNVLFAALGPVAAYRWWLLAHLWAAALGAYAWSWHRWQCRAGAMVAGFGYALCGFMVLHLVHMSLIAPAALIPWSLLGLDLIIERWTTGRAALLAGSIALVALSGHTQGLWMALAALGILGLAELIRVGRVWTAWARAVGGIAGGIGLAAVQLLPVFRFSRTSIRPHLTPSEAYTYSSAPRHLLSLIAPRLLGGYSGLAASPWRETNAMLPVHEVTNYLLVTLVALAALGFWDRRRDGRAIGLLVLGVFGILMSLADRTPFGPIAYHLVPLASSFRAWARVSLLTNLATVSLAAAGVRAVLRDPARLLRPLTVCTAVLALVVAIVPAVWSSNGLVASGPDAAVAIAWPALLLVLLGIAAALTGTRLRRWGVAALVVVCAVDATGYAFTGPWRTDQQPIQTVEQWFSTSTDALGGVFDASSGVHRWVSNDVAARSWGLVKRQQTVMGYDPLIQRTYQDIAGSMSYSGEIGRGDFWEQGQLADVLRVTTYVGSPDIPPTDPSWLQDGKVGDGLYRRWTRTPRLPESYLVGEVELADRPTIYWALRDPATDLRSFAFVEDGVAGARDADTHLLTSGRSGSSSGSMSEYGRGTYTVDADRRALLVVSYAWLDGWHATVDGHPATVTRANGLVLGVQVPAGHHVVRFRFSPPGLRLGALVSLLSLVALAAPTIAPLRRRLPWRAQRTATTDTE